MKTKITTLPQKNSINRPSCRRGFLVIALACVALSPPGQAVLPAPDGGYPGNNTAEGSGALLSLNTSSGLANTAIGFHALNNDVSGDNNTAAGYEALFHSTGTGNIALGQRAGFNLTTGTYNIDIGNQGVVGEGQTIRIGDNNQTRAFMAGIRNTTALSSTFPVVIDPSGQLGVGSGGGTSATDENLLGMANSTGNTAAEGVKALASITATTTGNNNTATGWKSLFTNTAGSGNTATGFQALLNNTTNGNGSGNNNTATGNSALITNTNGIENTATGAFALNDNTTGYDNTATGFKALHHNTEGGENTANGWLAMVSNTKGSQNTATGRHALALNTFGERNVAEGIAALYSNVNGKNNIGIGFQAGYNLTGDNNIDIGSKGVTNESNTIRIGTTGTAEGQQNATYVAGITSAPTLSNTMPVVIDTTTGQLGCHGSSQRFKTDIKPMDRRSDAILQFKPVTFHYKNDKTNTPEFGLIAEDVEAVDPDLVVRGTDGKPFGVRYDEVNAMLLNEFLKEHRRVEAQQTALAQLKSALEKQKATIAEQQKGIETLAVTLKKQAAQIAKVSAQIETTKPVPRLVDNCQ